MLAPSPSSFQDDPTECLFLTLLAAPFSDDGLQLSGGTWHSHQPTKVVQCDSAFALLSVRKYKQQ